MDLARHSSEEEGGEETTLPFLFRILFVRRIEKLIYRFGLHFNTFSEDNIRKVERGVRTDFQTSSEQYRVIRNTSMVEQQFGKFRRDSL